jgi:UPF0755 protein
MKKILSGLVLLFIIIAAGGGIILYNQYITYVDSPITIPHETILFEVKKGSSLTAVANKLEKESILGSVINFRLLAKLNKMESSIKTGEYVLKKGMKPLDVLTLITSGKSLQYKLTLIDGKTAQDAFSTIKASDSLKRTLADDDYMQILDKLGIATDYQSIEGLLFPDTYNFPKNTTDLQFIERSYKMLQDYLQQAWDKRDPQAVLKTPYEALILASIVEKETGDESERPMIARVFINRLNINMMLQTDPTVIYGMGESYQGNIRKKDLRQDTPYNTYTRNGLPPTPIALAGKAAINAVMHPPEGDFLYFVAKGDGSHYFSKNLREHNNAVNRYQRRGRK